MIKEEKMPKPRLNMHYNAGGIDLVETAVKKYIPDMIVQNGEYYLSMTIAIRVLLPEISAYVYDEMMLVKHARDIYLELNPCLHTHFSIGFYIKPISISKKKSKKNCINTDVDRTNSIFIGDNDYQYLTNENCCQLVYVKDGGWCQWEVYND